METWSGFRFNPETFTAKDVNILDIAQALSQTCRYGGHTRRFYSTAEHCCLLHDYAMDHGYGPKAAYELLHHDSHEAYVSDMTRPLKEHCPDFVRIEKQIEMIVYQALGVTFPLRSELDFLDKHIVVDERKHVMNTSQNNWSQRGWTPLGMAFMPIRGRFPWLIKQEWIRRHNARCDDLGLPLKV